jgi:hypothetical protein
MAIVGPKEALLRAMREQRYLSAQAKPSALQKPPAKPSGKTLIKQAAAKSKKAKAKGRKSA